jgi:protein-S-isoprenylcysteine O-methyltransferase Ste14
VNNSPWIIFVAVLLYGVIHSLLASNHAKELARRWFGEAAERGYRLAYNIFAVLSFLPLLALVALLPDRTLYILPMPWSLIALAVQGAAVLALLVGLWQTGMWSFLGLRQLVQPAGEGDPQLVVRGLYRWVRHPLYTAGLAFIWFTPLMTLNLLALNIGLTAYLVIGAYFEERKLLRVFRPAYANYQRSTPMLLPGLMRGSNKS